MRRPPRHDRYRPAGGDTSWGRRLAPALALPPASRHTGGRPNSDTGGEFIWGVRDLGFLSPGCPVLPRFRPIGLRREFATSVNSRVTGGHFDVEATVTVAKALCRKSREFRDAAASPG